MVNVKGIAIAFIMAIIAIVLVTQIWGGVAADVEGGLANASASNLPLSSLLAPSGVAGIVIVAGVLIGIITLAFVMFKISGDKK